mmetsp:Transcript_48428/g.90756  ORF Transcript_48428/g.90756 Transcript_48428/m.90756 type:complete len:427 (-) Transcript_48428:59-1339(-)
METLFGLFEAAAWVNEVLARTDDKEQELCLLSMNVQSVTQSIHAWSETVPEEDRNIIFNSNQVFPHLANVLKDCKQVLERHQKSPMLVSGSAAAALEDTKPSNGGFRSMLTEKMKQGSRTLQEGLEALSSKMGSVGSGLLRLPEDELSRVKEANENIRNLMPALHLAISANQIRGSNKRAADVVLVSGEAQRPRTALESGAANGVTRSESGSTEQPVRNEAPLLNLELLSEAPFADSPKLGTLTTRELRPSSVSTMSLDSAETSSGGTGDDAPSARLVLGRLDLQKKVKMMFPPREGRKAMSVLSFVSREYLLLEVPENAALAPTQGSMEMATLVWGCWNDSQQDAEEKPPLATVSGIKDGFHMRKAGQTRWTYIGKGHKAGVEEGDMIAIVMESPPGSEKPPMARDLEASEVRLILGFELGRPEN